MRLYAYEDGHYWGSTLVSIAQARGHQASLFDAVREVGAAGVVFYHMHCHPVVRLHHKNAMAQFATNPALHLIPSYRASVLYDDRVEQLRAFGKRMPPTQVFRSPAMAREYLESGKFSFPIFSKSQIGPGSRPLANLEEASREIRQAFTDVGIKNKFGIAHHGALFWQESVGTPQACWRVIIVGQQVLMERKIDNQITAVTDLSGDALSASDLARSIAQSADIKFGAFDFIQCEDRWWFMKMVLSWSMRRYMGARFFPDERLGNVFWQVLIEEVEKGHV